MKGNVRILNGYRVVLAPEHARAMKSNNWDGYVYEHILVAEKYLGRPLMDNEVVHHLNGIRGDNRKENLLVLDRSQHGRLHAWIDAGAPGVERLMENRVNSVKAEPEELLFCKICERTLQEKQETYCSGQCMRLGRRKVERPTLEQLTKDIKDMSMLAIGRKYGVSDNAVRKWIKHYNLRKPILSQAPSTLGEGAETSGGVKSP